MSLSASMPLLLPAPADQYNVMGDLNINSANFKAIYWDWIRNSFIPLVKLFLGWRRVIYLQIEFSWLAVSWELRSDHRRHLVGVSKINLDQRVFGKIPFLGWNLCLSHKFTLAMQLHKVDWLQKSSVPSLQQVWQRSLAILPVIPFCGRTPSKKALHQYVVLPQAHHYCCQHQGYCSASFIA